MKPRDVVAFVFAFGPLERYLTPVLGVPTLARVLRAVRGAGIEEVFLLTDLSRLISGEGGFPVEALAPERGGIERAIGGRAVLGVPGDLPLLTPESLVAFIDRFDPPAGLLLAGESLFIAVGESPFIDVLTAELAGSAFGFGSLAERYEAGGGRVDTFPFLPPDDALKPSGPRDLPMIEGIARRRKIDSLLDAGVSIVDPERTYIGEDVRVEEGALLFPGIHLRGVSRIGSGCVIGPEAFIEDSTVEEGSTVRYSVVEGSRVRPGCSIGPYAHLRPGADVGPEARIGNFVEVKAARLGRGVKAGHLAYIGDAEVGEGTNIGAGTVTCNYDGVRKNRTIIEDGAFIGSNASLVAPVRIGHGAFIAAGSTITDDVPPNRLAFGRARQVVKEREGEDDREKA